MQTNTLKKISVTIIFLAAATAIITPRLFQRNSPVETSSPAPQTETSCQYILSEYDGMIAVFEYGDGEPVEVFPVFAASLPEPDYEQLKSGIEIYSEAELTKLLNDFLS